jgi:hypothetical protein
MNLKKLCLYNYTYNSVRLIDDHWYYLTINLDGLHIANGITHGSYDEDDGMDLDRVGRLILEKECDII